LAGPIDDDDDDLIGGGVVPSGRVSSSGGWMDGIAFAIRSVSWGRWGEKLGRWRIGWRERRRRRSARGN